MCHVFAFAMISAFIESDLQYSKSFTLLKVLHMCELVILIIFTNYSMQHHLIDRLA